MFHLFRQSFFDKQFPAIAWSQDFCEIGGTNATDQHTIKLIDVRASYLHLSQQQDTEFASVTRFMASSSATKDQMKAKMLVQYLIHTIVHEFTHWARREYFDAKWLLTTPERIGTPFYDVDNKSKSMARVDSGSLMEMLLFGGRLYMSLPLPLGDVGRCDHRVYFVGHSFINDHRSRRYVPMVSDAFHTSDIGIESILNVAAVDPLPWVMESDRIAMRSREDDYVDDEDDDWDEMYQKYCCAPDRAPGVRA